MLFSPPPAVPVVTMPPVNTTVLAPGEAVFTCTVEGFPLPTITWVMVANDNMETTLMPGDNITIVDTLATASGVISSALTLRLTALQQSGRRYVCLATNTFGVDNESAILTITGE